jgi:hypothetical protein
MERYLVELDGDQIELLSGMVREAIKVAADEKKVPELHALLSALGTVSVRWLRLYWLKSISRGACNAGSGGEWGK